MVICAYGHAARMALGNNPDVSVEAAVIGIVDELEASPLLKSKMPPVKGDYSIGKPDTDQGDKQEK